MTEPVIVGRSTTLADGRELIYFDGADTALDPGRAIDARSYPSVSSRTTRLVESIEKFSAGNPGENFFEAILTSERRNASSSAVSIGPPT